MDEPKAYSLTIHITGALRGEGPVGDQLTALMQRVEAAIFETFPDFLPGNPPVWISSSELRDDWIRRMPREEAGT